MNIDTNTITTMTEANQNFSKVAKIAESKGKAVIFKNNKPKFLLLDLESNDDVLFGAEKIMEEK